MYDVLITVQPKLRSLGATGGTWIGTQCPPPETLLSENNWSPWDAYSQIMSARARCKTQCKLCERQGVSERVRDGAAVHETSSGLVLCDAAPADLYLSRQLESEVDGETLSYIRFDSLRKIHWNHKRE